MSQGRSKALSKLRELTHDCNEDPSHAQSRSGLQQFVHSLMDAHRYVHNRRTAAYQHYDQSEV